MVSPPPYLKLWSRWNIRQRHAACRPCCNSRIVFTPHPNSPLIRSGEGKVPGLPLPGLQVLDKKQQSMTETRPVTTRNSLITAAGELFAEFGYSGVTTRMIADRAGVRLSAIHYHFGNKEKLYIAACTFAHSQDRLTTFARIVADHPELMASPESQAEIIRLAVSSKYRDHFRADRPVWERKLLLQEITTPSVAISSLIEVLYHQDNESAARFYRQVKPEATAAQAAAWADLLFSPLLLYSMARQSMEIARGELFFDEEFLEAASDRLARALILEAGLPLPADLR